jgi:hypothetical protein
MNHAHLESLKDMMNAVLLKEHFTEIINDTQP